MQVHGSRTQVVLSPPGATTLLRGGEGGAGWDAHLWKLPALLGVEELGEVGKERRRKETRGRSIQPALGGPRAR